ncbi:MAG: phosphate acetyltransferase [Clostridiales bacterium]|jgi:phosphate acetyltransferase|nr:phosphate acetyltransferase [Clostridiales bacterium]
MSFLELIDKKICELKSNKKIILPESNDRRILKAAEIILKDKKIDLILVGNKDEIVKNNSDLDLNNAEFIDTNNRKVQNDLATKLYELRKEKGLTLEKAKDLIKNNLYFSVMLVKEKYADGIVAGATNFTADVLRPAFQILKTKPGIKLVSSFFVIEVKNKDFGHKGILFFSDCAINQNPSSEELAYIAESSATSFENLIGQKPKVALLSHSTKKSSKHSDVDKIIKAVEILKNKKVNFDFDGELQVDAALVESVAKLKTDNINVAGHSNVLIFPDLDAGNIGYKLVQRLGEANAYGPITQGIFSPVNDLSRGCDIKDIVGVIKITAAQSF